MVLHQHRPRARLRALHAAFGLIASLTLITCAEDPIGPGSGGARLRIVPVFGPYARVAPLALDRVRIVVERPNTQAETSDTIVDEARGFDLDATQLLIDDISIRMQEASEDVRVSLQLLSNATLLFEGSQTVTLVRGRRTQISIIVNPVIGDNVAVLTLAPRDTLLSPSAVVDYRLDAFDVQGAPVAQYYVSWSLTGGPATGARINAAGRLTAPAANDTFYVKVAAPNGVLDSTRVIVGAFTPPGVGAVPLAAGDDQSCQISGGVTYCWGANDLGQLGDGTLTDRLVPTPVAGGHTFVAVSIGVTHTCALTATGQAFCWGDNSTGALGDGTTTLRTVPVAVTGGFTFAQIAAANGFTCAVTLQGLGYCWGANFIGQLGDGTTTSTTAPVAVAGGHSFTRISAAGFFDLSTDHACAIDGTGQVWCWGANNQGQLGNGSLTGSSTPVAVGSSFSDISVGGESSCAITTTGVGFCWGLNFGVQVTTPQQVAGSFTYTALDMGGNHVCGKTATGWVCGGDNAFGQLGDGTTTDRQVPVAPSGGLNFTVLAAGDSHTCGLTATGTFCWGNNGSGQLGTGDVNLADHLTPARVVGAPASVTLSAGNGQTAPAGGTVAIAPAVLVRDAQGNPLPGAEVIFAVTGGGGTILGGAPSESQRTSAAGIATVSGWTLGPTAGANGLSATVSAAGVSGNPVGFTATGATLSAVTWTGATSSDWFTGSNWSTGTPPGTTDNVVIPVTTTSPILANNATVKDLTVQAGASVTVGDGFALILAGNLDDQGTITTPANGILVLAGTGGQLARGAALDVDISLVGQYLLNGRLTLGSTKILAVAGSLNLSGHTAVAPAGFVTSATGTITMQNPLDSLLVGGLATFSGGATTGLLTAGTLVIDGDFIQLGTTSPASFVASGTHTTVFQADDVTRDLSFQNPGTGSNSRFQNVQFAMIGFGSATLLSNVTISGSAALANVDGSPADLSPNGHTLTIGGSLGIAGQGVLRMQSSLDSVLVGGDVDFSGANTFGSLTDGVLRVGGNFKQTAVTSVASFAPSGTHKTVLGAAAGRTISIGSPGAGADGSHFQVLDIGNATGGLSLDVNIQADSLISNSASAKLTSPGVSLTVRRSQVSGLILDNTRFILDEQATFSAENFSNVTFAGFPTANTTMLTVVGPGSSVAARPPVTTTNVNFQSLPTGANNFYVDLTSSNSGSFTMTMTGSNQSPQVGGNGPALTRVTPAGAATVNWP